MKRLHECVYFTTGGRHSTLRPTASPPRAASPRPRSEEPTFRTPAAFFLPSPAPPVFPEKLFPSHDPSRATSHPTRAQSADPANGPAHDSHTFLLAGKVPHRRRDLATPVGHLYFPELAAQASTIAQLRASISSRIFLPPVASHIPEKRSRPGQHAK